MRVFRISPPDIITVTDGRGTVARCAAAKLDGDRLVAEILERDHKRPLRPEIVVYQGAPKGHKMDEIVERLAELGVREVVAYGSRRTVVRWDDKKAEKLRERWLGICRSVAKQSRNPFVMATEAGVSWTELVRRVAKEPLAIVLWEEASLPLRTALVPGSERIALVVGPEGGLARDEAEALADAGGQLVSLGPRVLRTEVAPVVTATAVLYHYELIG